MAAEADKVWDVAIVGSGFAGALIAPELGKGRKNVIILEAGAGVPPNFNAYMRRFYSAAAKVPESPYTPEIFGPDGLSDPNIVNAGRPTVLSVGPKGGFGDWTDPKQAYLIQKGPRPFARHLRSHRRRHVALARHVPALRTERFQDEVAIRSIRGLAYRI